MSTEYKEFGVFALAGDVTQSQLEAELQKILREQNNAADEQSVQVKPAGAGFAGSEIVIICLPLALKIIGDLWDTVFLPRIEKRWGKGAITRATKS